MNSNKFSIILIIFNKLANENASKNYVLKPAIFCV